MKEDHPSIELGYCLNVHPIKNYADIRRALFEDAPSVYAHNHLSKNVGLWFPNQVLDEMRALNQIEAFIRDIKESEINVFTLNAFPYGLFHGKSVKDNVYLPDWSAEERLNYTCALADIFSQLMPHDATASISTVPLAYRAHLTPDKFVAAIKNLDRMGAYLKKIYETTGKKIQLALEPEPDCLLDSMTSVIDLFRHSPFAEVAAHYPDHLGICLDLVHVAVEFETPEDVLNRFIAESIPVFKVQLGAALTTTQQGIQQLAPFSDEVYLHQTKIQSANGELNSYPDLPDAIKAHLPGEWRIHYHIPLSWDGSQSLGSTRELITPQFFDLAVNTAGIKQFEVEVYTLGIFPNRKKSINKILSDELQWSVKQMHKKT